MTVSGKFAGLVLAGALLLAGSVDAAEAPIEVMVVGTFHMSNPGRDGHNMQVDDVLKPDYQAQIARVNEGLARFKPTVVAVEWPADIVAERYPQYRVGTLKPSRNEVVQLGFRLAKTANLEAVHGIDVDGDFPYDAVDAYAKAHGQEALLAAANAEIETMVRTQDQVLKTKGVAEVLRFFNDPAAIDNGNGFYRLLLRIGGGKEQPGADLLGAWYKRNFLICANLVQLAKPGDRVVVFFGSGHAFQLRQCVKESPGYKLVETNDYLPH